MSMERKRVILCGLILALAGLASGPTLAQDPMLQPPPRIPAPGSTQSPEVSPAPTSTRPAPKKSPKQKGKQVAAKPTSRPAPVAPEVVPAEAAPSVATPAAEAGPIADSSSQAPEAVAQVSKKQASAKKGKQPYAGPKDTIELPPTPMLDEEGRQRLAPSGLPMSNPPVKQQRDKNGHPAFDDKGKPVFQTASDLGYDEKGKKIKTKKEKVSKTPPVSIAKGTLTVDGMIGKAALNYEIKEFKFVYLYAPWIGTVIVSNRTFPGAQEQRKAFDQHTLTVSVDDHQFQVYSEKVILGKKTESAFVVVDRDFKLDTKYPAMGYGKSLQPPYGWPGAKASPESKAYVKPPPLPPNLRPTALLPACPEGQVRPSMPSVKPGTQPAPLPCVVVEGAKPADAPAVDGMAPAGAEPPPLGAPPVPPPTTPPTTPPSR